MRVDKVARETHFPGAVDTDEARQLLRQAPARQNAHARVRVCKSRMLTGEKEITGQGQLKSARHGGAVDRTNNRLWALLQGDHDRRLRAQPQSTGQQLRFIRERLQINARAENAACSGQHDGADRFRYGELSESRNNGFGQLAI